MTAFSCFSGASYGNSTWACTHGVAWSWATSQTSPTGDPFFCCSSPRTCCWLHESQGLPNGEAPRCPVWTVGGEGGGLLLLREPHAQSPLRQPMKSFHVSSLSARSVESVHVNCSSSSLLVPPPLSCPFCLPRSRGARMYTCVHARRAVSGSRASSLFQAASHRCSREGSRHSLTPTHPPHAHHR